MAMPSVRVETKPLTRLVQYIIQILALCWPALINGAPLVYPDTRSYFMGGHAAVEKVMSLFARHGDGAASAVEQTVQKARGVRSAFYSLFTYIPAVSLSLWLVILLQAVILTALLRLVFGMCCRRAASWDATIFILVLASSSTVSFVTSIVMPDVFTPMVVLSLALLISCWSRLTTLAKVGLWLLLTAGITMHLTNLPIVLGLLVLGVLFKVANPRWSSATLACVGAIVVAIFAMLSVSYVGFKQVSLAPQSPPFLMARSIEDGPGRLYLEKNCPQIGLYMCKHLDKLDMNTERFIWDSDGVYSAVSPEEQAQMRAEDKRIYIAAALAYPYMQVTAMVRNTMRQLMDFGVFEYAIPSWADYTNDSMTLHLPDDLQFWQYIVTAAEMLFLLLSLVAVIKGLYLLPSPWLDIGFIVLAAVVLEAFAGAVSEPAPRYEARVIWLVPMLAYLAYYVWKSDIAPRKN